MKLKIIYVSNRQREVPVTWRSETVSGRQVFQIINELEKQLISQWTEPH